MAIVHLSCIQHTFIYIHTYHFPELYEMDGARPISVPDCLSIYVLVFSLLFSEYSGKFMHIITIVYCCFRTNDVNYTYIFCIIFVMFHARKMFHIAVNCINAPLHTTNIEYMHLSRY